MELWDSAALQARLWKTSLRLNAPSPGERMQAVETLGQAGSAAVPCLRFHLLRQSTPRVQFAAAIALHRQNVPEGMETLLQALLSRLYTAPDLAPLLEEAFLAVGSPTATLALQSLWSRLPEWQSDTPTPPLMSDRVRLICRIWAGLQDPLVLDTLIAYATRIPDLFPPTVAAFGQMAMRKLRDTAQSADPLQRLLVVRTLERIPGEPSFQTLTPMLRDPDPSVRSEACCAIAQVGPPQPNSEAVARAIQAGYSTVAAVQMLATIGHPRLYDILLQLVERAASLYQSTQDTPAAVRAALDLLMQAPSPPERRLDIVCTLLEKPIPREVVLAGIPYIELFAGRSPGYGARVPEARYTGPTLVASESGEARAQGVLWNLLADPAPEVRARAAQALILCGDPNGKCFLDLLAECRPQGSFIEKLTTLLRGGPDATQAATQAVQQVQQWVTRLSREAVVRLSSPTLSRASSLSPLPQDPRIPTLTRRLLTGSLRYLASAQALEETEEALALSITAIRALRRLTVPDALTAQTELLRAFHTRKQIDTPRLPHSLLQPVSREIGEPVREEAALALIELLGPESFGLFVEALGASAPEIQGTAILALGRLGDARAVPYLQPIAGNPDNLLAPHAVQALAVIRQNNPEMMTLLRGSSLQDAQPETLLRPLPYSRPDAAPELLLRPTSNGEPLP